MSFVKYRWACDPETFPNHNGLKLVEIDGFMLKARRTLANLGTRRLKFAEFASIRQDLSIKIPI